MFIGSVHNNNFSRKVGGNVHQLSKQEEHDQIEGLIYLPYVGCLKLLMQHGIK
jgi:hypothetical protein